MKLSATKPISSPGRAEKFPPPLMRFLRSNVGSRSRGRTRASPMFVRKKSAAMETQEPSSPKVTCMGQVRVRRSSKSKQAEVKRTRPPRERVSTGKRCGWIRNTLFCHNFSCKIRTKPCRQGCPNWSTCFQRSFKSESQVRQDSTRIDSKFGNRVEELEQEEEQVTVEDDEEEIRGYTDKAQIFASNSCTPPRNALLLTRCRSAPYRSSSLAIRFWESPLRNEEETREQQHPTEQETDEHVPNETPSVDRKSISVSLNPKMDGKMDFFKGIDVGIMKERISTKSENLEELKRTQEGEDSARPLVLTRCKSEPARTAEKLDPELHSWRKRGLDAADSSSAHVLREINLV